MLRILIEVLFMKFCSKKTRLCLYRLKKKRTRCHLKRRTTRKRHIFRRRYNIVRNNILQQRVSTGEIKQIVAPASFNISKNADAVLSFFDEVKLCLEKSIPIKIITKNITELSVDTLLYLIAIMQDAKENGYIYHVEGDLPENEFCKKIFQSSGFFKYVRSKNSTLQVTDNSVLHITSGTKHDPQHIKKLCEFIQNKLCIKRTDTRYIFTAITELMQNTIGHAYPHKSQKDSWFLFASFNGDNNSIDIAFLDTGVGIPATVRKNFVERIEKMLIKNDSGLIMSALRGHFRTQTNLKSRGKGLPSVYNRLIDGSFSDFTLISNYGYIYNETENNLSHKLMGTLYSWRIKK